MSNDLICVTNLTKKFKKKYVFSDLCVNFPKNQITVIYGKSGSGKSTLLKILGAIENYQGGNVYFNGQKLPKVGRHKATLYRRKNVSFIFQDYGLIKEATIKANLELGAA